MKFTALVFLPVFLSVTCIPVVTSGQLYLQPAKKEHGFFTEDNFFITCFTADDTVDQLKWIGADGVDITAQTGRIHIQPASGAQQGLELVVESVQKEDAGKYVCSDVQNSLSFELFVYKSISFGNTPKVQHSEEFKTATIECHIKRDPMPSVSWYVNGSRVTDSPKYKVHQTTLTIHNASRNDAGLYRCQAFVIEPLASQVKDMNIHFEVHYMPEWVENGHNVVYAPLNTKAVLSCEASASPVPKFQWLKNGETIENDTDYTITSNDSVTSLHLMVRDEDHYGIYTCRASNNYGWIENQVDLKEGVVPDHPSIKVVKETEGTLTLDLNVANDLPEGLNVVGFRVQYKLASADWDSADHVDFQIGEEYVLKNMSYNSQYVLRAASFNAAGHSEYSEPIDYKTHSPEVAPVVASSALRSTMTVYALVSSMCFAIFSQWLVGK